MTPSDIQKLELSTKRYEKGSFLPCKILEENSSEIKVMK